MYYVDNTCATKSRYISYDLRRWRRVLGEIRGHATTILADVFPRDAFNKHIIILYNLLLLRQMRTIEDDTYKEI